MIAEKADGDCYPCIPNTVSTHQLVRRQYLGGGVGIEILNPDYRADVVLYPPRPFHVAERQKKVSACSWARLLFLRTMALLAYNDFVVGAKLLRNSIKTSLYNR